jgi:O-methyltransferase
MIIRFIRNFFRYLRKKLNLNKKIDLKKIIPEITENEIKIIKEIDAYSMTPQVRKWLLIKCIHYINKKKIKGDIVECGIWKGGNLFLAKKINDIYHKSNRKFYGYDTFSGMPKPEKYEDNNLKKEFANNKVRFEWLSISKEKVKKYAKIFFDDTSDFYFIEGKVENTLKIKKNIPKKISLLRLDTDYYTSTKIELEKLYEKLSKGGILIIDDYGDMRGAKKAVDDFFRNKKSLLIRIDKSCRVLIKN